MVLKLASTIQREIFSVTWNCGLCSSLMFGTIGFTYATFYSVGIFTFEMTLLHYYIFLSSLLKIFLIIIYLKLRLYFNSISVLRKFL